MIYVVGESHGGPAGRTKDRLASLFGVSREEMLGAVVWLNLWEHPGVPPETYVSLVNRSAGHSDAIVLLGSRVASAFGATSLGPLGSVVRNGGVGPEIVAVPHPSGLNRWWNRRANVVAAGDALSLIWRRYAR